MTLISQDGVDLGGRVFARMFGDRALILAKDGVSFWIPADIAAGALMAFIEANILPAAIHAAAANREESSE